jgi:glycosyltransferase involved in cell wall biosynthesis
MKITIVTGFFLPVPPLRGGATEKIWYRFAQEFAAAGNAVTFLSRRWPSLPNHEIRGGITHLRITGCTHTRYLPINLALDWWWSRRVLRQLPPADVIVSNNVSLPLYANAIRRMGAGRVAVVLGRMPKGQTRFYNSVDRLYPTSNAVFEKVRTENPRVVSRCRVILNPADCALHQQANVKPQASAPLTVGYVGRLNPEKGLEILIDAAKRLADLPDLPPWRLLIIGPHDVAGGGGGDSYRDALLTRASGLNPGRCQFVGPIYDAKELAKQYGQFDVFCYPTRAERGEGLSVAPIEAMAAGAVPVLSALPCYKDLIVPGTNGILFNHRSPSAAEELAAILARLLRDGSERNRLAHQAQRDAWRFDYGTIARSILEDLAVLAPS